MTSTTTTTKRKLFIFGLGFSASRAALAFHREGHEIAGTSRTLESAQELTCQHPHQFSLSPEKRNVFIFDGSHWDLSANGDQSVQDALTGTTHIIVSVPTGRVDGQEDPVLFALGEELIATVKPTLQWLAYLSTIGVYGETNGAVVDETAPVQSTVKRSQMRITAEKLWLQSALPCHIFRIAGIYGPGRGTITKVRSGSATRIDLPGRLFNRIHVDDIVNILEASAAKPNPGAIYNVADDEPAPAEEVTAYACELLSLPVMPLQSWEEVEKTMSAMAKSFYAESKVVSNTRVKEELGVVLRYPTYREGLLAQILEEETAGTVEVGDTSTVSANADSIVVLANIGSLKPEPYLDLRQISFQLSRSLRQPVVPCSFRFSNRIDAALLHGMPAKTLEMVLTEFLKRQLARLLPPSTLHATILPLFFGNSATLTEFLPTVLRKSWASVSHVHTKPSFSVAVGRCLVDLEAPSDNRVARIMEEKVRAILPSATGESKQPVSVLVLEHGTPNKEVHDATEFVAKQLRELLPRDHVDMVAHACMERREGSEYDFNDPLLEKAIDHYGITSGVVIIALLFFSQGRHAGEKGDIEEIVDGVKENHPHLDIRISEPLGTHPLLAEILQDRFRQATQAAPQHILQ